MSLTRFTFIYMRKSILRSLNSINHSHRVCYSKKSGSGSSDKNSENPVELYSRLVDQKRIKWERQEAASKKCKEKEQQKRIIKKCMENQEKILYTEMQCMDKDEKKLYESMMDSLRNKMKRACKQLAQKKILNEKKLEKKCVLMENRERFRRILNYCQMKETEKQIIRKTQREQAKVKESNKSFEEDVRRNQNTNETRKTLNVPQNRYILKLEKCIQREWTDICSIINENEKKELSRHNKCLSDQIRKICQKKVRNEICTENKIVKPKNRIHNNLKNASGKYAERKIIQQTPEINFVADILRARCEEEEFIRSKIKKLKLMCRKKALRKKNEAAALKKKSEEEALKKNKENEALKRKCEEEAIKKNKEYEELKRKCKEEAERKNQLYEELKRKCEEQAARKNKEYEAIKRKCEEQAARKNKEYEELKRKCKEEALKKNKEFEELKRKRKEEAERKNQLYEELKRKCEEQAARKNKEYEAIKRKCEEEAARKNKEYEALKTKCAEEGPRKNKQYEALKRKCEEALRENKKKETEKKTTENDALGYEKEEDRQEEACNLESSKNSFRSSLYKTLQKQDFQPGNKVSVVGAGVVGMACAMALLTKGVTNNIALYDIRADLCVAERDDQLHGSLFLNSCSIDKRTSVECTKNSRVVVVTTVRHAMPNESRLQMCQKSADIIKQIMPQLVQQSPKAVFIIVSNPVDVMAWVARRVSDLPYERCFSIGCHLDSSRFRMLIAQMVRVSATSVYGFVLGEQGNNSVPLWSSVTIGGTRLHQMMPNIGTVEDPMCWSDVHKKVVKAAYQAMACKAYSNWGIALTVSYVVSAIFENSYRIMSLSTNVANMCGIKDEIFLSLPCIVNQCGLHGVIHPHLSDWEKMMLKKSAAILLNLQNCIKI